MDKCMSLHIWVLSVPYFWLFYFLFVLFYSDYILDYFLIRKEIKGCEFGSVGRILEHLGNGKSL